MCLYPFAVGCGSGGGQSEAEETTPAATAAPTVSTPTTTSETQTLVGRWERVNECPQLVKAFEDAGLAEIAASFVGDYFPDATPKELAQKTDACKGARS